MGSWPVATQSSSLKLICFFKNAVVVSFLFFVLSILCSYFVSLYAFYSFFQFISVFTIAITVFNKRMQRCPDKLTDSVSKLKMKFEIVPFFISLSQKQKPAGKLRVENPGVGLGYWGTRFPSDQEGGGLIPPCPVQLMLYKAATWPVSDILRKFRKCAFRDFCRGYTADAATGINYSSTEVKMRRDEYQGR